MLRGSLRETIFIKDRELVHSLLPVVRRTAPFGRDVAQRQPDQFAGRIVAGEVPARLDDLAQARVDALYGIGRVDHPTNLRREGKERNHVAPGPAPGRHHGGEPLAPGAPPECGEFGLRSLGVGRRVDRADRRRSLRLDHIRIKA